MITSLESNLILTVCNFIFFSLPVDPPELVWILREWTELHANLFGGYKIKLSLVGLTKIFMCNNPNLEKLNITVKGDLVAVTGRSTRYEQFYLFVPYVF